MTVEEVAKRLVAAGFHVTPDDRVKPVAAAHLLGVSVGHLANLRSRGQGPDWFVLGTVWYRIEALLAWIEAGKVSGDATPPHGASSMLIDSHRS